MLTISIWNNDRQVASIWSPSTGRPKQEVFMILDTLYNIHDIEQIFYLSPKAKSATTSTTPDILVPHHYLLIPLAGITQPPLELPSSIPVLFPSHTSDKDSLSAVFQNMQLQARPLARSAKFRFRLAQRDRTCVLTNAWEDGVVAVHIIPHEWQSTDLSRLPQHIREVLGGLEGGIGSFENGMLLDSSAHTRFDNGHWGVVWKGNDTPGSDGGVWEVVAITSEGAKYAGKSLRWLEGIRDDGVRWRNLFPPPELFKFHLQCAIFKHCTGRGEGDDIWEDYDHAATKVLTSEEAFERWANGSGRIVPSTIDKSGTAAEAVL